MLTPPQTFRVGVSLPPPGIPVTVTLAHRPGRFNTFHRRRLTSGNKALHISLLSSPSAHLPHMAGATPSCISCLIYLLKNPNKTPALWSILLSPVSSAKHHLGVTADIPAISRAVAHRSGSRNLRGILRPTPPRYARSSSPSSYV